MKIRHSVSQDDDAIIQCLIKFADYQPLGRLRVEAKEYNDHHLRKILDAIRKRGIMLVATQDDDIRGVFMAILSPDIWVPQLKTLSELVWWVNPEYRDTTTGYRLLQEYTKIGKQMVKDGTVANFTMTLLENSPPIDLEKRGWQKIESNYVYQGE